MANPNRKMATMRRVSKVEPIEGADRIEAIHVDGWVVVDQKGLWHEGDLCVFYEVDTAMPTNDPRYSHMAAWGEKSMVIKKSPTMVHVLKTRKFRGQYSQGYIAKPQDVLPESVPEYAYEMMYERKARLDGICNVCEYHPEQGSLAAGFIGRYNPRYAPRTDAERVQNIDQETFDLIKRCAYYASVKVDGTSITAVNDDGELHVFSHNNEFGLDGTGQIRVILNAMQRQGLDEFLKENPGLTCQMELCGPKIGNNTLRLEDYRLFVFSLWDVEYRHYVAPYQLDGSDTVEYVLDSCVPYVGDSHGSHFLDRFDTPQDLIEWTNTLRGSVTKDALDEGVVVHVLDTGDLTPAEQGVLRNALGEQLQMKSVSAAFLLKKAKKG